MKEYDNYSIDQEQLRHRFLDVLRVDPLPMSQLVKDINISPLTLRNFMWGKGAKRQMDINTYLKIERYILTKEQPKEL